MGFIYCISSARGGIAYYGSTSRDIYIRFDEHKEGYDMWKASQSLTLYSDGQMTRQKPKFITSYKVLKWGDAKVEMVEDCPTVDLIEREKHHIRSNPCVNMIFKDPRHYHGYHRPK
jgi:hypothetical protein